MKGAVPSAVVSVVGLAALSGFAAAPLDVGRGPVTPERLLANPVVRHARGPGSSVPARSVATTGTGARHVDASSESTEVFEGIANQTRAAPPDPTGDVSASQYVQSVNGLHGARVAVFDKTGNVEAGPFDLSKLWDTGRCRNHGWGDPVVQFDPLAQRWLLTQFAFRFGASGSPTGPYSECVAVSKTSDAAGSYYPYSFKLTKHKLPDFPKFGVWPDGYYMSIHLLGRRGATAQGIVALDRENMLTGAPARELIFFVNKDLFGLLPADLEGPNEPPPGAPEYLVVLRDNDLGAPADKIYLYAFVADWDQPNRSEIDGLAKLPAQPFDSDLCGGGIQCIPQKGTKMNLDASAGVPNIGAYLMYPLVYRNFGDHEALAFQHTVRVTPGQHAAINWFELRDPSSTPTLYQQGTYAPDELDRWVGSIAMDAAGDIALAFSTSSNRTYPSIAFGARSPSDPLGKMSSGDSKIVSGGGSQTGSPRWGDYTALSVDPVDDCTFWFTDELYPTTSRSHWHTAIASFKLPSCSTSSPPASALP